MNSFLFQAGTFTEVWGMVIYALKAAILMGLTLVVIRQMSRSSGIARYMLLRGAVAAVLALPVVELLVRFWNGFIAENLPVIGAIKLAIPGFTITAAEGSGTGMAISSLWPVLLAIVWSAGFLWFIIRIAAGIICTRRITKNGIPFRNIDGTEIEPCVGIPDRVRVLVSLEVTTPFAWGMRNPVIVMPSEAREWSSEKLRYVLRHELTHLNRRDHVWMVLAGIVRAVHWFNPLAWSLQRKTINEMEKACDDAVLAEGANPENYSKYLIEIIRKVKRPRLTAPVGVQMARYNQMEGRIMSILRQSKRRTKYSRAGLYSLTGLTVLAVLILAVCGGDEKQSGSGTISNTETPTASNKPIAPAEGEFIAVETMPEMISMEEPAYPENAKKEGLEGKVWVKVFVDPEGDVQKAEIGKSSGHKVFDEAALDAAMTAKFKPAEKDGKPVAIWIMFGIDFTLSEDK